MYDVKSQVAKQLKKIPVNVAASSKEGMKKIPCIIYKEMDNKPADPTQRFQEVVYIIDIYNQTSTSPLVTQVNDQMKELGLLRTACIDMDDPGGLRHKHMKFMGVVDTQTEIVYQKGVK